MDRLPRLVSLLALLLLLASKAGAYYTGVSPPEGFEGKPGDWTQRAIKNAKWSADKTMRVTGALNTGGRSVSVPVLLRMAPNAARYLARLAFANPYVLAGSVAFPYLAEWAAKKGFYIGADPANPELKVWLAEIRSQQDYDPDAWRTRCEVSADALVQWDQCIADSHYQDSQGEGYSTRRHVQYENAVCSLGYWWASPMYLPGGFYGCFTVPEKQAVPPATPNPRVGRVLTRKEFEDGLADEPMPWQVPNETGLPVPVELPTLWPSPEGNPTPTDIPLGRPQPIPDTNPQEYSQPVTRVTPAPTQEEPYRVDTQPRDRKTRDPQGIDEPTPKAGDDRSEPKTPGLCDQYPDILACTRLDQPSADDLPKQDKRIDLVPDSGWGGAGQCPAPRYVYPQGREVKIPFDLFCSYLTGLRPVILAMAWLSAALLLVGGLRGSD